MTLSAERALKLICDCNGDHLAAIRVADDYLGRAMDRNDGEMREYWFNLMLALIPDHNAIGRGEYDA